MARKSQSDLLGIPPGLQIYSSFPFAGLNLSSSRPAIRFQNAVKYYAAYLSYLGTQRPQQAEVMFQIWQSTLGRSRGATEHGRVVDWYNGYGF